MSSNKMPNIMAFIAISFAIFSAGSCSSQVPLVMWSSEGYRLPLVASPAAGHIISNVQLMAYLNSVLESAPQNVILFLQDKLSKDDFTMYGGVFGNKQDSAFPNLESALQTSSSLVLPGVSWLGARAFPALLQEKLGISPLSIDVDTLEHLQLNASSTTLLVIHLPYSSGAFLSCKEVLRNNDEIIGKVLTIMKTQGVPYTAFYTGLMPSRVIAEPSLIGHTSMRRTLLQSVVNVVEPLMFNNTEGPCIMLWAQNITVSFNDQEWTDLGPLTFGPGAPVNTTASSCSQNVSRLVLDYGTFKTNNPFRLIFNMSQRRYPVSARNWFTLDTVELEFNSSKVTFNGSRGVYAPSEYSFHCQNVNNFQKPLLVPRTVNDTKWRILFTDFQIQGFNINKTTNFSYASDCASFFTPGIWMGLVTSLLMLLILTFGLHMIMQLRSMDRFDDPKGPSISVPQSE
ncbi:hypothetical protein UPYG_G00002440 [Umbra pygmaea]|uniref:Uncharacterized protein n=1 Tax=Umbra pygmaea TaxID=75934 RepID=A0ABD0XGP2_UMBPY